MSKVILPKEVVVALDFLQGDPGWNLSPYGVIKYVGDPMGQTRYPELEVIHEYFFSPKTMHDSNDLMRALLDGYEVEPEPADVIKSVYDAYCDLCDDYDSGLRRGIRETLDAYGIKVEGVNAK